MLKREDFLPLRKSKEIKNKLLLALTGAAAGLLNGLFGGGGGIIVVPALTALLSVPQKQAHATAILIILPVTALSVAIYLFGNKPDFSLLIPSAIGVALGGALGAKLLGKMPQEIVGMIFSAVLFYAGVRMIL